MKTGLLAWSVVLASALLCLPLKRELAIVIGVIAGAVLARWGYGIDAHVAGHQRQRLLLAFVWSGLVTVLLLRGNLQAEWGITDDHEIVRILGPTGSLSLAELVEEMANHREIGAPTGNYSRYRPGYFVLRLVECFLWGEQPSRWYAARLVMFGLSAGLFWLLLERWLGGIAGSLVLLAVLTYPFWADLWTRLGPAEIYAVLGIALYATGLVAICGLYGSENESSRHRKLGAWALLLLGGLIAVGSKENFLLLVPLTWVLGLWLGRRGKLDWRGVTALLLLTATGALILAIVGLDSRNFGTDLHGRRVETLGRLELTAFMIRMLLGRPETRYILAGLAAVLGWAEYARWEGKVESMKPILWRGGAALALGGVVLMSQFYFYDGRWPSNGRYDFPGLVALFLMIVVPAWMLLRISEPWPASGVWLRTAFLAGLLALILMRGYGPLREGVRGNVIRTQAFSARIDRISELLREDDNRPVVFVSTRPQDYQGLVAVRRFLRSRHVANPYFLRLEVKDDQDEEAERNPPMMKLLEEYSSKGDGHLRVGRETFPEHFAPLHELPKGPVFEIEIPRGKQVRLRGMDEATQ